ncbi:MAG: N-acyl-D-amino-acid deacylase family protein [Burkholderiales bacterium]
MYDLLIRAGMIADGSGKPAFTGDVAITDGLIVATGKVEGPARRTLNADGLLVTPGFVDVHTHYDGQATWDPMLTPSCWHGVTTAVMGNCGVGFAPMKASQKEFLIELMEGVEDIPGSVLAEGVDWAWESFPEYLDALESKPRIMDLGAQLPHAALRYYVMGERGAKREHATAEDMQRMSDLTEQALKAGAMGFTTSRTILHKTARGDYVPNYSAAGKELLAISQGVRRAGRGVLQLLSDFENIEEEFGLLRECVKVSGRSLSFTLVQRVEFPQQWRELLVLIEKAQADGLQIRGQVAPRAVGLVLGLQGTLHPFMTKPSYVDIAHLPLAERVVRMRDPAVRARILAEPFDSLPGRIPAFVANILASLDRVFPLGDPPEYEPAPEASVAGVAARTGQDPMALMYDLLLEGEGRALLFAPAANYTDFNYDSTLAMLRHPHTVVGLGDGGAHCGSICDGGFPTYLLTHWTRDRTRGERLPLELAVQRYTRAPAELIGLTDRGLIAPGMKADINIIDHANLSLSPPHIVSDLPAGGRRLMQTAKGYAATIVSGQVVIENDQATGALPGKLLRGGRAPGK